MADELSYFQKKFLEEKYRSLSDKEIAKELGIKKSAVRKALKSMKLERTAEEEMLVVGGDNDGSEKPDSMSRKTKGWINLISIAIIIVFTFAAYANSLGNDFIWDDEFLVRDNMYIRSFSHLKDIFTSYLASSSGNINNFYRPLQDLSYMIDYFFWGYDPMGFRLTNIILHSLCAALIYILMARILGDYRPALLAGLFFGVHPINTEAVTYIAGRADPLYLVFFLSSFILFLKVIGGLKDDYPDAWFNLGAYMMSGMIAPMPRSIIRRQLS